MAACVPQQLVRVNTSMVLGSLRPNWLGEKSSVAG
jgi:hypothetical protein